MSKSLTQTHKDYLLLKLPIQRYEVCYKLHHLLFVQLCQTFLLRYNKEGHSIIVLQARWIKLLRIRCFPCILF